VVTDVPEKKNKVQIIEKYSFKYILSIIINTDNIDDLNDLFLSKHQQFRVI